MALKSPPSKKKSLKISSDLKALIPVCMKKAFAISFHIVSLGSGKPVHPIRGNDSRQNDVSFSPTYSRCFVKFTRF